MLKKNERKDIKDIILKYDSLYEIDDNKKITPSLAIMINNYLDNQSTIKHTDYEYRKLLYLKNKNELSLKKQYNNLIVNLYQNGKIIIDKEECELKYFYILYEENSNKYYLTYSKSEYTDFLRKSNTKFPYNKAIKFIDSTVFILLINDPSVNINNNTITVDNKTLLSLLDNWDGLLHNKIWFTESISNKKILKEE